MTRESTPARLTEIEHRLRMAPGLSVRDTRVTADGLEFVVVDSRTGQLALVVMSPVNQGTCPGCSHVAHGEAARCEAIAVITKTPCACRLWAPRFPEPDRAEARA